MKPWLHHSCDYIYNNKALQNDHCNADIFGRLSYPDNITTSYLIFQLTLRTEKNDLYYINNRCQHDGVLGAEKSETS